MSRPTLDGLAIKVSALEHDVDELRELVDGQESWSHRRRLHTLENEQSAARLVADALKDFRELRSRRAVKIREWGAFVLAVAAVIGTAHPWSWW